VNGAGASILRAGREVDYGWYFFGSKRRENYDDWWRCEIAFDPDLDELFGINHSKQQISPTTVLKEILSPDIEAVARALNARVKSAFARLRAEPTEATTLNGNGRDQGHRPAPMQASRRHADITPPPQPSKSESGPGYSLETRNTGNGPFLECDSDNGMVRLILNGDHPFYQCLYGPVAGGRKKLDRTHLESLLLALARIELEASSERHRTFYRLARLELSKSLKKVLGQKV
jgi:hypothetical protein